MAPQPVASEAHHAVDTQASASELRKAVNEGVGGAPKLPRVKFMTKKEREKMAKDMEKQKKQAAKEKAEELRKRRREHQRMMDDELRKAKEEEREERRRRRKEEEETRRRERAARESEEGSRTSRKSRKDDDIKKKTQSSLAELHMLNLDENELRSRQEEAELALIKKRYLGIDKMERDDEKRRKLQKPSEKFRNIFNFEWDNSEDTSKEETNELYRNRVQPQLLFGRGFIAGVDVREQKKKNNFYDKLSEERQKLGIASGVTMVESSTGRKSRSSQMMMDSDDDSDYGTLGKGTHWSEKKSSEMTKRDWKIFREDMKIYLRGGRVPIPCRTWAESPLPVELLKAINEVGYIRPTPIQMQAIPVAMEQRDLIGIAETGSGKTAAYMLPMLTYVNALPALDNITAEDGPYGIVMAPTRELALQIEEEGHKFSKFSRAKVASIVGGRGSELQAMTVRGCEIVIATPGKLNDALEKKYTVLNQCFYVVLDEADKMIDMGFEGYVNEVLDRIPASNLKSLDEDEATEQEKTSKEGKKRYRITQMFSATMPTAVERLARKYLRCPAYISIGDPGAGKKDIEQRVLWTSEGNKRKQLKEVLQYTEPPIIVFVNVKKAADVLGKWIEGEGYSVSVLHGGKHQDAREQNMENFRAGYTDVLVATDVAGRGLDIDDVQHVVNFDMPKNIEDYTHRIGRTGRAGKKGLATSLLTKDDEHIMYDLKNFLEQNGQIVPQELQHAQAAKFKPGTLNKGQDVVFVQ
ncbi:hypothetical protein FOZ61_004595 [Perkinsus olseni]|uniref:RNA helicase n=5 Tax=Perkinsus olseni TaxID=32597 RepID=A0A7J6LK69_PEROL|nr:hypothetical protein FOZ61_004595 [Perkinsus olseni]